MSFNDYRTPPTSELFSIQPGPNEFAATYIFGNQDHTLGNSLRYILAQNKNADFVGYSVPHPYEPKMHLRLQTRNIPAIEVLKEGLKELEESANILDDVFIAAMNKYISNHST